MRITPTTLGKPEPKPEPQAPTTKPEPEAPKFKLDLSKLKVSNPIPSHVKSTPPKVEIHIKPKPELMVQAMAATEAQPVAPIEVKVQEDMSYKGINTYDQQGNPIKIDDDQRDAVDKALDGQSFALVGGAGTGKTTVTQAVSLGIKMYHSHVKTISYRIVGSGGQRADGPSVAMIAYSNRATDNLRAKLQSHPELKDWAGYNVTTVHNLLEYTVEFYYSEELEKNTMRYVETRNADNKLEITHLIVEEGSTIGAGANSLWEKIYAALPEGVQIIFLGDVGQIQPIGGKPILSYALLMLASVELTTIHRQAFDNPIIEEAYNLTQGNMIKTHINDKDQGIKLLSGKSANGKITKFSAAHIHAALVNKIPQLIEDGDYDPLVDMWLCPFNKSNRFDKNADPSRATIGTRDINAIIADYIAKKEGKKVWEIKTGFNNIYLSVGDRCYYNKQDVIVTKISINSRYAGKIPQEASTTLNYYGNDSVVHEDILNADTVFGKISYAGLSARLGDDEDKEGRVRAASHIVDIQYVDNPEVTATLSTSGDFGDQMFSLGYALSVHKAIGSEWPRVFVVLHDSHATLLYREMLYTAMTRPRQALTIIAQEHVIQKCINRPRIQGNCLADKIEYFNGGYLDQDVEIIP